MYSKVTAHPQIVLCHFGKTGTCCVCTGQKRWIAERDASPWMWKSATDSIRVDLLGGQVSFEMWWGFQLSHLEQELRLMTVNILTLVEKAPFPLKGKWVVCSHFRLGKKFIQTDLHCFSQRNAQTLFSMYYCPVNSCKEYEENILRECYVLYMFEYTQNNIKKLFEGNIIGHLHFVIFKLFWVNQDWFCKWIFSILPKM